MSDPTRIILYTKTRKKRFTVLHRWIQFWSEPHLRFNDGTGYEVAYAKDGAYLREGQTGPDPPPQRVEKVDEFS